VIRVKSTCSDSCRYMNDCKGEHDIRRNTNTRSSDVWLHSYDLDCIIKFDAAEVAQVVEALDAVYGGLPDDGAGVAEHHAVGADRGRRCRRSTESGSWAGTYVVVKTSSHMPERTVLCIRPQALLMHGYKRRHISAVLLR